VFAVFSCPSWFAATLVSTMYWLTVSVLTAGIWEAFVDREFAVVSGVSRIAFALVAIFFIFTDSLHTRIARTFIYVNITFVSCPSWLTFTLISVQQILALSVNAWVRRAFVYVCFAVLSSVPREAVTLVRGTAWEVRSASPAS